MKINAFAILPRSIVVIAAAGIGLASCKSNSAPQGQETAFKVEYLSEPLVKDIYTSDPSAHVFNDTLYIYPSHDIESGIMEDDSSAHFDMKDYHVFSMDSIGGSVKDNGIAVQVSDLPWAKRQIWAPDAAYKNGIYYLYFPANDAEGVFKICVATSSSPTGPFKAEHLPIKGSFSIDPAVFTDSDGQSYMYFGGIWGGQLQKWQTGKFDSTYGQEPADDKVALSPKVAKLSNNMLQFDGAVQDVQIVDKEGRPLMAGDHERRFLKHHGFISITASITFLIQPAIRIT